MTRSQRRLALLAAAIVALLVLFALLYQLGMSRLEGKPRDFWSSLGWSAETLSTTGYGADSHWSHPVMAIFVVLVQFAGVFLVFLIVPVYLIPFLEERFERRLPSAAPRVDQHVLIFRSGPAIETVLGDLRDAGVTPVVVEADEARARRLADRGVSVVVGTVADGVLSRVRLDRARALILNGGDDENALVALVARQSGFSGEVIALVEEPSHRKPLQLAGATRVFTPRHALGAALAARASRRVHPSVAGLGALGRKLHVAELRISPASSLAGRTLAESEIGGQFGVTILGLWEHGELRTEVGAQTRLDPGTILIAAGAEEHLARFGERISATDHSAGRGRFVIAGLGEVGTVAREILGTVGEDVVTIDRRPESGADIVGDFLDPEIVARVEPGKASAMILALDQDAATLFAALVVREHAPHVPIIARVNEAANVERIHLAGADFALSISQVAGQILGHQILHEESISVEPGLRVRALDSDRIAGRSLGDLALRDRAGCSVVAVERGEELLVQLDEGTRLETGDRLYVCGPSAAIRRAAAALDARTRPRTVS
ncbi:MAG: TrkA family potassium uptake protein [Thermoanaerobaculia bacterium]